MVPIQTTSRKINLIKYLNLIFCDFAMGGCHGTYGTHPGSATAYLYVLTVTLSSLEIIILYQDSLLACFAHRSGTFPQLFHSKLKTLLFSNAYSDSSSSPDLPHPLNSKHHPPQTSGCLTLWILTRCLSICSG